jgi:hypothetical protein
MYVRTSTFLAPVSIFLVLGSTPFTTLDISLERPRPNSIHRTHETSQKAKHPGTYLLQVTVYFLLRIGSRVIPLSAVPAFPQIMIVFTVATLITVTYPQVAFISLGPRKMG